jgi:HlyD family secretion protein
MKFHFALSRQFWFALFGAALLLALGWVAATSGPLAPIKVTVTRVDTGEVKPVLFGIGTVEARRVYLIGPTVAGRVSRVLADVGDAVTAGQLLAEMDPVDLDARVSSAAAGARRARNAVAEAQAQLEDARSRRDWAAGEAQRYIELGRQGFVSPSIVEGKVQQQRSAEAQLDGADSALAGARQDLTRLDAERQAMSHQRVNFRLLAPADGVVTSRDAEPGSTVVAGQAVLKLMDPESLWVTVRLDQARSHGLGVGLPAEITLRSRPGASRTGRVVRVEPVSDSVTEERIARVAFESLPPDVSTGELAEVTLQLPVIRDALLVPNASLRQRGARTGVWLHAQGLLRFVPVTTRAESPDGRVQVVEGLKAGDEVVVYSERDLKDDSRIKVVSSLRGNSR